MGFRLEMLFFSECPKKPALRQDTFSVLFCLVERSFDCDCSLDDGITFWSRQHSSCASPSCAPSRAEPNLCPSSDPHLPSTCADAICRRSWKTTLLAGELALHENGYGLRCNAVRYTNTKYLYRLTYIWVFGFSFVKVGVLTERLTKKYDTSNESWVPGAVPGVGLMLIRAVWFNTKYLVLNHSV